MDQWSIYEDAIKNNNVDIIMFEELLDIAKFLTEKVKEMNDDKKLVLKILGCECNIG